MNELQIFQNPEFGEVRTVSIDGEPWLVGKDVATALGYVDTFGTLKKHVDDEDKQNCQNDSFESPRGMTVINESGLYSLVLSSKLPTAKKFKRWVTSEVLPTIRKTGSYSIPQLTPNPHYRTRMIGTAVRDVGKTAEKLKDVATMLSLSQPSVLRLVDAGEIPFVLYGRTRMYRRRDVMAYINNMETYRGGNKHGVA